MYVLGQCKFKCFIFPAYLSYVSHSFDICNAAIKNVTKIHCIYICTISEYCIYFKTN